MADLAAPASSAELAAPASPAELAALVALADDVIGDRADAWDRAGAIPDEVVRKLAARGCSARRSPPAGAAPA